MNKAIVSKEVANAIEHYKSKGDDWCDQIFVDVLKSKQGFTSEVETIVLDRNFNMLELADVLLNGYEVELSPVEKWNGIIKEIKGEIKYHNDISNYEQANEYEAELSCIEEMNRDFKLGLDI